MTEDPFPAAGAWMARLSLRHLQQLRALAEYGSVSEAARGMGTTQPALSKWLKELEEAIGAPLFERHARGLTPTPHGHILLVHASRVINQMQRAQQDLVALDGSRSVHVRLGVSPLAAPHLAPRATADFLHKHPHARIDVQEHTMRVLARKLEEGELDIVLGSLDDFESKPGLHSEKLREEPLHVIARRGHPLESRKKLGWDDLAGYAWVLWPRGTANRAHLDAALVSAGRAALSCRVESSSLLANLSLVAQTDLLCAVSDSLARHVARRLEIATLDISIGTRSIVGMCWREDPLQDVATLDMLHSLRQSAA